MKWKLYIDESGDFSEPDDEVVVAGVLVRDDADGWAGHELFNRLQDNLPHIPWPPHTAHIKHPAARVVWHAAARDGDAGWDPAPASSRSVYDRAVDYLLEEVPEELAEAQRQALVDQNHWEHSGLGRVDWHHLIHFENLLNAHDPEIIAGLEREMERDLSAFRRELFEALPESDRNEAKFVPAYITVGGETWRGDAENPDSDRYVTLLERMIERANDVLARNGGDHEVHLLPLARHIQPGDEGQRPLQTSDLEDLVTRIEERKAEASDSTMPVLKPASVAKWTDKLDSRHAVADFVANQFRQIAEGTPSLETVELELSQRIGLPARSPSGKVTTLAAAPTAAEKLGEARKKSMSPAEFVEDLKIFKRIRGEVMAPWVYEQAAEWLREE